MEKSSLKHGIYLIKANNKKYKLTEDKEKLINLLNIDDDIKNNFKELFNCDSELPKSKDLLVELIGNNLSLKIKSVKISDTDENITHKFNNKNINNIDYLWSLFKHLEWIKINNNIN